MFLIAAGISDAAMQLQGIVNSKNVSMNPFLQLINLARKINEQIFNCFSNLYVTDSALFSFEHLKVILR